MSTMPHAGRAHARFGASSAHRWMACPGSWSAEVGHADRTSDAALEGTAAHELLETRLKGYEPEGSAYAPDMRETVQVAVDAVQVITEDFPGAQMLLEQSFEIPVDGAAGEVFGTSDVVVSAPEHRLLMVLDYKHGQNYVEVRGNKQCRFYALGALHAFGGEYDAVGIAIIQPRVEWAAPVRWEWLDAREVLAFGDEIAAAIRAAKQPDAPRVPGEEQCRYCRANLTCPARQQLAVAATHNDFRDVARIDTAAAPVVASASNERLGKIYAVADQVRAYLSDNDKEIYARLMGGQAVPGVKLVEAQARRSWDLPRDAPDSDAEVVVRAQQVADCVPAGVSANDFVRVGLVPVGEAEKILKTAAKAGVAGRAEQNKAVEEAMQKFAFMTTKKSSGNLTMARDDDPRPAVNRAGTAFAGVQHIAQIADTESTK